MQRFTGAILPRTKRKSLRIARYYPDDKPGFLLSKYNDHSQCISLGVYLVQKAELETTRRDLEKLREKISSLHAELAAETDERQALSTQLDGFCIPSEPSNMVFYMIEC